MGMQVTARWVVVGLIGSVLVVTGVIIGTYHWGSNSSDSSAHSDNLVGTSTPEDVQNSTPEICEDEIWKCNLRLDSSVEPMHYELYLHPDIPAGTFTGNVSILLNVTETVDHLRLHTKDLNITSTSVVQDPRRIGVGLGSITFENEAFEWSANEYWVVKFVERIVPGVYVLSLSFSGSLTRGIVGFYRSTYFDPVQKIQRYVVSTKFQPTYARRVFPCFDEPSFKSTFTVTIVKPSTLWALSNMPLDKEVFDHPAKGLSTLRYQKSERMVTYLLAVAMGDFKRKEGKSKSGTPVNVYSTSFQVNKIDYAATIAPKILDFYEAYFGTKYPLPKLDIIGIPDFVSGAMEHWGLISFRETNLFFQKGISSAANKQRVAAVIAHEIVHQWFGNLVTLKWWDELWLNEGFASYLEYKGVDSIHPEWDMPSQFVSTDMTPVMVLDGQRNSHPIVQAVSHPDQITEIFDKISYNKGATVIRMLENFMGPSKFRAGVTNFLKKYSFSNAATEDLWHELQLESNANLNISRIMDTWTRQTGYPVISVNLTGENLVVQQSRFFESVATENATGEEDPSINHRWEVPLQIGTPDSNTISLKWLDQSQKPANFPIGKNVKWVKLNAGQFGYFRVQYTADTWKEIQKVYLSAFTPEERCGLLDDVFALAYGNYVEYDIALEFGKTIASDEHYVPWDCAIPHIRKLSKLLRNSAPESYGLSKKYIASLTSELYAKQKWSDGDGDNHLMRLLKFDLIALSCENGVRSCLEQAKILFTSWINESVEITPGLRGIVYKYGMQQSINETVWDVVLSRYNSETDPQEKVRLISCLASSKESFILQRFLNLAKNESIIRRQDFFTAFKLIASNPIGNNIAWNFYRNEYAYLLERFTINDRYFGRAILDVTSGFSTTSQLDEMKHFFSHYPDAGAGRRARATALENVQNNIEWAKANVPSIEKWLKLQNYTV